MLRHGEIEQKDVRLQLLDKLYRLGPVRGFAQDLHLRFRFQQPAQAVAENRMVIGNYQAHWLRLSKIHSAIPRSAAP